MKIPTMVLQRFRLTLVCFAVLTASCSEENKSRGPIVLGDSSTMIIEKDSTYLRDLFDDVTVKEIEVKKDTVSLAQTQQEVDREQKPAQEPEPAQTSPLDDGLHIPFKEITVFIPDIKTRTFNRQNPAQINSVSYLLTDGKLKGNSFRISGATITRVSQRYMTTVMAKSDLGALVLETLNYTSKWAPIKGTNNTYAITGLEETRLDYTHASRSAIKKAITAAARKKRLSRQATQRWEASLKNVRSVNDKPLDVYLRSIMWKIEGREDNGKAFEKQIRIDLPL
jgi:hypothetical protein